MRVKERHAGKKSGLDLAEIPKKRKSYFGVSRGIGLFSSEDEMKAHG